MDEISIFPHEFLLFDKTEKKSIFIKNKSNRTVAYLIKTNSPDFFSVKPAVGILKKGEEVIILIKHLRAVENIRPAMKIEIYEYKWMTHTTKAEIREMINLVKMIPIKQKILNVVLKAGIQYDIPYFDKICNSLLLLLTVFLFVKMTYI